MLRYSWLFICYVSFVSAQPTTVPTESPTNVNCLGCDAGGIIDIHCTEYDKDIHNPNGIAANWLCDSIGPLQSPICADGYIQCADTKNVFLHIGDQKTWFDARDACTAINTQLARIENEDEYNTALQYMEDQSLLFVWVGLNDINRTNQYRWSDATWANNSYGIDSSGNAIVGEGWLDGEPNADSQDCIRLQSLDPVGYRDMDCVSPTFKSLCTKRQTLCCHPSYIPTQNPTTEPTLEPIFTPSADPTLEPTINPTAEPSIEPTTEPTIDPSADIDPTLEPTIHPTADPTLEPTTHLTEYPTTDPTLQPTTNPSTAPTIDPTVDPTAEPTIQPTTNPSLEPTTQLTTAPSVMPTIHPTTIPTRIPTIKPATEPTKDPTTDPTTGPIVDPTYDPTSDPTLDPTTDPTKDPTLDPIIDPTKDPTLDPTIDPSTNSTTDPTKDPTIDPSTNSTTDPTQPTTKPTMHPTKTPTIHPTINPSIETPIDPTTKPTFDPTRDPTVDPTLYPTIDPTLYLTIDPTNNPTSDQTSQPTTVAPTAPTKVPSESLVRHTTQERSEEECDGWKISIMFRLLDFFKDVDWEEALETLCSTAFIDAISSLYNGSDNDKWCNEMEDIEFHETVKRRRLLEETTAQPTSDIEVQVTFVMNDALYEDVFENYNLTEFSEAMNQYIADNIPNTGSVGEFVVQPPLETVVETEPNDDNKTLTVIVIIMLIMICFIIAVTVWLNVEQELIASGFTSHKVLQREADELSSSIQLM